MGLSNNSVLDKYSLQELALEILSFAGGENTISEDQAMKTEEARTVENWDAISLGGMQRSNGFNEVADGGASYTNPLDLLIQHKDAGGTNTYGIVEGDLIYKNGSGFTNDDNGAFTSGVLSHGVSDTGGFLWITNSTDNLKKKAVGVAIATPASVPPTACARIYKHKNRLTAEGSATYPYRVYGTRTGIGNWTAADAWSLSNDAWSVDVPGDTRGMVMDFPSGNEQLVFTEEKAYALSNFPNTAFRAIGTPSRGCGAPYSIALGNEGVYFVSRRPTLGVFLFDGNTFTELTQFNHDVFVDLIDFSKRIFGFYRNRKYYLIYNETNSGVTYPNRMRVYDAKFGRWMNRPVNTALSDNFGYPARLQYSNNEFYCASSQKDKIYELETTDNSDEGQNTLAVYKTKTFSSRDFALASGGQFPIDDVRMKLLKMTVSFYGTVGAVSVLWDADRGLHSGSKSIDLTATGDNLNTTFIVNTSYITTTPADKTRVYTFPNDAVGRRFQFTFSNSGTSVLPKIKKIKITAVALEEA